MLQWSYVPIMLAVFIGAEVIVKTNDLGFIYTISLMFLALIFSFGVECIIPYQPTWNKSQKDILRDVLHFIVNETSNYSFMFLLPFFSIFSIFSELWPIEWRFEFQLLFAIVIFDIGTTLFHYLSHKSTFLWRFHIIHHSSNRLYGFNGVMKHPVFQMMDGVFAVGPLLIIGLPQDVAISLVFCILIQLLVQHTNVNIRTGWARFIFATAELHRFHHVKGKAGDVNFALFFSFWDRLLGTSYFSDRPPLRNSEIGVNDIHYPTSYWQQLKKPFILK